MHERIIRERPTHIKRSRGSGNRFYGDLFYPGNLQHLIIDDFEHTFYAENEILDILNKSDFGGSWQPRIWDCEDRVTWGYIHVRQKLKGCPIGRADGFVVGSEEFHSVIIFWLSGIDYKFYDPNTKSYCTFIPMKMIA